MSALGLRHGVSMIAAVSHNGLMAKKKTGGKDRHTKKGFQMRLHPVLRGQLERLVEMNTSSISEEVRTAIRERLERLNLWPVDKRS